MSFVIKILVEVKDKNATSYKDPKGLESVDLYCTDVADIEAATGAITNALIKVAAQNYQAEIEAAKNDSD